MEETIDHGSNTFVNSAEKKIGQKEIEHRFGFHKATIEGEEATKPLHTELRVQFKAFANELNSHIPEGREKSLLFTALEEASMWAHKAVANTAPLEES